MISLRNATLHERRIAKRLEARGDAGQAERLLGLKGVVIGERHRVDSLYAVGGEGAVYLTHDVNDPENVSVAKVALLPVHRPFELDADLIRRQRDALRVEARFLADSGSTYLPRFEGLFEFGNPILDAARGDAFGESEPLLLMEKLPGHDLDRWLARTHRSHVPQADMRRTLDRVAVVLLQALVDLVDRGFLYADLRPGNLRMLGSPERRIRLLDAGSLVSIHDRSGRFPHVPAYLPPAIFERRAARKRITPTPEIQAVMAGRTLYEVATGLVPRPGAEVDLARLANSDVSPPVAEAVEGLCRGDFPHVRRALNYLAKRARRRVVGGNDPRRVQLEHVNGSATPAAPPPQAVKPSPATPAEKPKETVVIEPPKRRPGLLARIWRRLLGKR